MVSRSVSAAGFCGSNRHAAGIAAPVWRRSTAVSILALLAAGALTPAKADDGAAGTDGTAGYTGSSPPGLATGTDGGAGVTGGGGTVPFGDGGTGGTGGGGAVLTGTGSTVAIPGVITGGRGGDGGIGNFLFGGFGGVGGTGGSAVVMTDPVTTVTVSGTLTGGHGGTGGNSNHQGGGDGGKGGAGLTFTDTSLPTTVIVNGTIQGGAAGQGGAGAPLTNQSGATGIGGAAIVGANLNIINNGTISVGASSTVGAAIFLSGGVNTLTLGAGSTLNGGVDIEAGTLALNVSTAASISSFSGAGTLIKTGAGTLTTALDGSFLFPVSLGPSPGLTILDGTVRLVGNSALDIPLNYAVAGGALVVDGPAASLDLAAHLFAFASISLRNGSITGSNLLMSATDFDMQSGSVSASLRDYAPYTPIGPTSLIKSTGGTVTLSGTNTYSGGTTINGGTLSVGADVNLGAVAGGLTFNGGILQVTGTGFTSTARSIIWGANGGGFDIADPANAFTVAQALTGSGGLSKLGAGILTLSGANTYSGATNINAGTLRQGAAGAFSAATTYMVSSGATLDFGGFDTGIGSLSGAGNLSMGSANVTVGSDNTSTTFSGVISGSGGFTKTGTGRTNLTGISTYTGATVIDGGTLSVNGDITSSSGVTVNAGGTLGGNGFVGNTTINGGALAPGNSIGLLTVVGNLVLNSASSYMVEVSPTNADRVNVTGTATLGGATVNASFAAGSYVSKQYTIVNAGGGVIGTFGSQVNTNLPANFTSGLSYDARNAYLDLTLSFGPTSPDGGTSGSANQRNVGNALVNYFNRIGSIPLVFGGLTGSALSQASGETATGSQQATFDAMTQFMGLLTDPFTADRGVEAPGANGYAEEGALGYAAKRKPGEAFAMVTKVPPRSFEARWNVWGAGYGGSQTTNGNATLGSNTAISSIGGFAIGADHWLAPNTVAGFALAGGGTSFSVAGGGSGHSDLFQAGAFIRHSEGSAYVTGVLAYGWQDISTERVVTISGIDRLRAEYSANSYSARVEGGNRYVLPYAGGIGITPYAAAQVTAFDLPSYGETANGGVGTFALNYAAETVTATRSELGFRADKSFAVSDAILTLRSRVAWAHDYNTDRSAAATFQTLPGATFIVSGAAPAHDVALTTASAEMKFVSGISLAATFEGEFSNVTTSYAGKGVARYAW